MTHFNEQELSDTIFRKISDLIYSNFGINLTDHKRALVKGRLLKLVRDGGFRGYDDYLEHVLSDPTGAALSRMLDRLTTNYTFFMREKEHFDFFVNIALTWAAALQENRKDRDIRIWSAGCSSGEEPYTLAMLMLDHFGSSSNSWDLGVLATDISANVLKTAAEALYPAEAARDVPESLKRKYFRKAGNEMVEISESIRRLVLFRRFNLMRETFPFKGRFHIIFCRNVMIYFDAPTKQRIIQKFHDFLEPGGYLFVGHSESLDRATCPLQYIKPAVYRRKG
ncbi:MAG: chemotaxis protein CheR [Candidatus Wallbacteria bacterium HGW-Wallbacteria-1]|jgi:chemotaxis protein methyltransferase CheR|uniref:protein-glutamate O-methyltransferase n=1 Tax=Candidatus Wallbacteria bacterium HGW-Wallbacteria-1 TaxID=2013854 RepID=A0A2N1PJ21_9BACT|nr:MAG: chemotaxis protein CheR [Candidatus Wallbacteria bacterium HGW-Wallbacteria-1]